MKQKNNAELLLTDLDKYFRESAIQAKNQLLGIEESKKINLEEDLYWEDEPYDLQYYVTQILKEPPLTDTQLKDIYAVIGEDPKKIFNSNRPFNLGVLAWAKGGGKNYCISKIQAYLIDVLLCLKSPFKFFDLPHTETQYIDTINVAKNASEATNNFFDPFVNNVKKSLRWRDKYRIIDAGRLVSGADLTETIYISTNKVEFPKNVRCFSFHSQSQSYEGYSPLVFVADEFSSFNLGPTDSILDVDICSNVLSVLRSSASTRFGNRWIGFIISYLRHQFTYETEPTYSLIKKGESNKELKIYGTIRNHWQLRTDKGYDKKPPEDFFTYTRVLSDGSILSERIPIEFQSQFLSDPRDAEAKFLGILPSAQITDFFQDKQKIDDCVKEYDPLFEERTIYIPMQLKDGRIREFVGKTFHPIREITAIDRSIERVLHVDAAATGDRAVVMLASLDGQSNKVVINQASVWEADMANNRPISNTNIEEFIAYLYSIFNIVKCTGDTWQPTAPERLNQLGVDYETDNVKREDYLLLRSVIYEGLLHWYPIATYIHNEDLLSWELKRLEDKGHKVEKRKDSTDDCSDALAGVVRHFKDLEKIKDTFKSPSFSMKVNYKPFTHPISGQLLSKPFIIATPLQRQETTAFPYKNLPKGVVGCRKKG